MKTVPGSLFCCRGADEDGGGPRTLKGESVTSIPLSSGHLALSCSRMMMIDDVSMVLISF